MRFFTSLLILFGLGVGACAPQPVGWGKLTLRELTQTHGTPVYVSEKNPETQTQVYEFKNRESYQVKNEIVEARFREPQNEERSLLYWKHRFEGEPSTLLEVKPTSPHRPLKQLTFPHQGITLVFEEHTGWVNRIIEYEKN